MRADEHRIAVTVHPFQEEMTNRLAADGLNFHVNMYGRKMSRDEVRNMLLSLKPTIIIAGTEKYDEDFISTLAQLGLKLIARVGVGYDSVDVAACRKHNIVVSYGPTTCTNAVAELTIATMIMLLRNHHNVVHAMRCRTWDRFIGRELRGCNVGVIGCGRIGSAVIEKLQSLKPRRILTNDLIEERMTQPRCEPASKMQLLNMCDVVTLHVPGGADTKNMIAESELSMMKENAVLINFSRGGVISEVALSDHCKRWPQFRAAVDVWDEEPYKGPLLNIDNIIPTPHLGSCTDTARLSMEGQAVEDVLNYIRGKAPQHVL